MQIMAEGGVVGTFASPRANYWCGPQAFVHEFTVRDLVDVVGPFSHFAQQPVGAIQRDAIANKTVLVAMVSAVKSPQGSRS